MYAFILRVEHFVVSQIAPRLRAFKGRLRLFMVISDIAICDSLKWPCN